MLIWLSRMKIVNIKDTKKQHLYEPLFTGEVVRQSPVTDNEGSDQGVRNKFHKHSNDQVLIVTKGKGTVATKKQKAEVRKGDVIWAPAGEEHWHGAAPNSDFSHISVTRSQTKLTQVEK